MDLKCVLLSSIKSWHIRSDNERATFLHSKDHIVSNQTFVFYN